VKVGGVKGVGGQVGLAGVNGVQCGIGLAQNCGRGLGCVQCSGIGLTGVQCGIGLTGVQ
jgi:hypothetical protein